MLLPVEIYTSGVQYVVTVLGMFIAVLVMVYVVTPVYYASINRNCYEVSNYRICSTSW